MPVNPALGSWRIEGGHPKEKKKFLIHARPIGGWCTQVQSGLHGKTYVFVCVLDPLLWQESRCVLGPVEMATDKSPLFRTAVTSVLRTDSGLVLLL